MKVTNNLRGKSGTNKSVRKKHLKRKKKTAFHIWHSVTGSVGDVT
jgi:hypothetical protein